MQSAFGLQPEEIEKASSAWNGLLATVNQGTSLLFNRIASNLLPVLSTALDAGLGYLTSHAGEIDVWITKATTWLVEGAVKVYNWFTHVDWSGVGSAIASAFHWITTEAPPLLIGVAEAAVTLYTGVTGALAGLGYTLAQFLRSWQAGTNGFMNGVGHFLEGADKVINFLADVPRVLGNVGVALQSVFNNFMNTLHQSMNDMPTAFGNISTFIVSGFNNIFNSLRAAILAGLGTVPLVGALLKKSAAGALPDLPTLGHGLSYTPLAPLAPDKILPTLGHGLSFTPEPATHPSHLARAWNDIRESEGLTVALQHIQGFAETMTRQMIGARDLHTGLETERLKMLNGAARNVAGVAARDPDLQELVRLTREANATRRAMLERQRCVREHGDYDSVLRHIGGALAEQAIIAQSEGG